MRVTTLLKYLIGDRRAIMRVAADRSALPIGALFVLSAGFAREYDARDLLSEPWWLLIPFAASIVVAFVLFVIVRFAIARSSARPPKFAEGFRQVLALVWMTAPLAWLYAIPYERFLAPVAAAEANIWTLGLVAAWRVVLISRAAAVIGGSTVWGTLPVVLFMGDIMLLAAMHYSPLPIIDIMGGVQMSERDRYLANIRFMTQIWAMLALPVLFLAALLCMAAGGGNWRGRRAEQPGERTWGPLGWIAVASVLAWAPILPYTQSEQRLSGSVDALMKSGQIDAGLRLMSAHARDDFPPAWDPPPNLGYRDARPPLLDVVEALVGSTPKHWPRDTYLEKFETAYLKPYRIYDLEAGEWERVETLLARLPEGEYLQDRHQAVLTARRQKQRHTAQSNARESPSTTPSRWDKAVPPATAPATWRSEVAVPRL